MKKIIFILALLPVILYGQQDRVIRDTGGGGSGWLKDSLQAGRVSIDAPGNTLSITSIDSFRIRSEQILLWVDDSLNIKIDSANTNDEIVINNRLTIDNDGIIEMWGYDKTFNSGYGPTDNGKITYNSTDQVPMFRNNTEWVNLATEADITSVTSPGNGGIYGGDGKLPENVRASGGPSEYKMEFDSIGVFEIKDWNEGQALRIVQDFSGVTKFGRGITYTGATDSLDISYTEAGANSVFTIDATKVINIDAKSTVINPDSISMNFGNATFTDNRAGLGGTTHGIKYAANYSSGFVSRSLVDKAYCDANAGGDSTNFIIIEDITLTQNIGNVWEIIPTTTQAIKVGNRFSYNTTTDLVTYLGPSGYLEIWFEGNFETANTFDIITFVIRKNGTETRARCKVEAAGNGELMNISGKTYISVANSDDFDFGCYFTTSSGSNINLEELYIGYKWIGQ